MWLLTNFNRIFLFSFKKCFYRKRCVFISETIKNLFLGSRLTINRLIGHLYLIILVLADSNILLIFAKTINILPEKDFYSTLSKNHCTASDSKWHKTIIKKSCTEPQEDNINSLLRAPKWKNKLKRFGDTPSWLGTDVN